MKFSLRVMQIVTIIFLVVTSIVTLIMLFNAFEQNNEKYFPAFLLSQIYVMPLLLSALALTFLVFFEPENIQKKSVVLLFRIFFFGILVLFGKYLFAQLQNQLSVVTVLVLFAEEILIGIVTILFFRLTYKN